MATPRRQTQLTETEYVLPAVPKGWRVLEPETRAPSFEALEAFLRAESTNHEIYPPAGDVYRALDLTPLGDVRVFLLGQDPYPGPGQAHGLSFSVRPGVKPPASLRNIFKELHSDLGIPQPSSGSLVRWAERGVLLLNAVLTVRAGEPNSHRNRGWEAFTDAAIRAVSAKSERVVFLLWGAYAQKKIGLIDTARHAIIASAHPSPLSARNGFFGSRPFSRANDALEDGGLDPVDWSLD